ncbi:MAG: DUF4239 domain-containing protein [Solirubrobacteraceae bacterium]|nr:DUF4239 domain-containing protein [Solirubrobacteraceae bacterium]
MISPGPVLAVLIVVAAVAFAVIVSYILRRIGARRPLVKEMATTSRRPGDIFFVYGVILGLILVTAIGSFNATKKSVSTEASALVAMSRSAAALPPPLRDDLDHQLVCYARVAIEEEWPSMQQGSSSPFLGAAADRIPQTLSRAARDPGAPSTVVSSLITSERDLSVARRERADAINGTLPGLFWFVLIAGGLLVVVLSALMMYNEYAYLQMFIAGGAAALVAAAIVLVASFDRPFAGETIKIGPERMEAALASVNAFAPDPRVDRPCP